MSLLPVIRTERADEDLIDIWASIAADNPDGADRVLDAIEARWQQLAEHPYSGLAREDIAPNIRHLIVGQYLTLYQVTDECVAIIRVLTVAEKSTAMWSLRARPETRTSAVDARREQRKTGA